MSSSRLDGGGRGRILVRDRYEILEEIGSGTFGEVSRARDWKQEGRVVAIKRIKSLGDSGRGSRTQPSEGVPFSALREIKILREIHHPHVVEMFDVFILDGEIHCVFEFAPHDLRALISERKVLFDEQDIRAIMWMLLSGIQTLHENFVLHRDLKPENILFSESGVVKLADFGLARLYAGHETRLSPEAFTRWYKPPELLFGSTHYGGAADMWSVGCIFAELLRREPLFPGSSDLDQLARIFALLGSPSEDRWEGVSLLPNYVPFETTPPQPLAIFFTAASEDAVDLLQKMLMLNPKSRIDATMALSHRFFVGGVADSALQHIAQQIRNVVTESPSASSIRTGNSSSTRIARSLGFQDDDSASPIFYDGLYGTEPDSLLHSELIQQSPSSQSSSSLTRTPMSSRSSALNTPLESMQLTPSGNGKRIAEDPSSVSNLDNGLSGEPKRKLFKSEHEL